MLELVVVPILKFYLTTMFVELDKTLLKILCTLLTQKKYADRLKDVMEKTKLKDAVRTGVGKSKEEK
jgi:acetyl-CoA carboxylase carboxyl transferase subunit beta